RPGSPRLAADRSAVYRAPRRAFARRTRDGLPGRGAPDGTLGHRAGDAARVERAFGLGRARPLGDVPGEGARRTHPRPRRAARALRDGRAYRRLRPASAAGALANGARPPRLVPHPAAIELKGAPRRTGRRRRGPAVLGAGSGTPPSRG